MLRAGLLTAIVLHLSLAAFCAQDANSDSSCWVHVHSLKNASLFSLLTKGDQDKVLHALSDDMLEMAELDIAGSSMKRAAYRAYFTSHLEFKSLPETTPDEKLLLIRYHSNTMCGSHENCPVWVVRLTHSGAQSMVPWQNDHLGTSIGGGWGVGERSTSASKYPELMLLTHLSSTQTGLACFRESKQNYLRVDCAPECAHLFEHRGR
jgi:hypothetical protein